MGENWSVIAVIFGHFYVSLNIDICKNNSPPIIMAEFVNKNKYKQFIIIVNFFEDDS